jgi:hypothetical protein
MIEDKIKEIRAQYAEFSVKEQDYHILHNAAYNVLCTGKSVEYSMLFLRNFSREYFTEHQFRDAVLWVFDREEHTGVEGAMFGRKLVDKYFSAFERDWNGEKALAELKVMSPAIEINSENVIAVLRLFAALQVFRLDKPFRKRNNILHSILTLFFVTLSSLALWGFVAATIYLAEAGGVAFITVIGIIFSGFALGYFVYSYFNFYLKIRKYTR